MASYIIALWWRSKRVIRFFTTIHVLPKLYLELYLELHSKLCSKLYSKLYRSSTRGSIKALHKAFLKLYSKALREALLEALHNMTLQALLTYSTNILKDSIIV